MNISLETQRLARQLGRDLDLLAKEIEWALAEERINRVTPDPAQFKQWQIDPKGLYLFWEFANKRLGLPLNQEEALDLWRCIELTLSSRKRKAFAFTDYLIIAMTSEPKCQFCERRPPDVRLDIDHILPFSKGGSNASHNLRFLCESCNRSRGNRFHWAEVWRNI